LKEKRFQIETSPERKLIKNRERNEQELKDTNGCETLLSTKDHTANDDPKKRHLVKRSSPSR